MRSDMFYDEKVFSILLAIKLIIILSNALSIVHSVPMKDKEKTRAAMPTVLIGGWSQERFNALDPKYRLPILQCINGEISDRKPVLPNKQEVEHAVAMVIASLHDAFDAIASAFSSYEKEDIEKVRQAVQLSVRLCLEEALQNAMRHAYRCDLRKKTFVEYGFDPPNSFQFSVQDQGSGFDYTKVPDPTLPENIELPNGRGLYLIKTFMDTVKFTGDGRRVTASIDIRRRLEAIQE